MRPQVVSFGLSHYSNDSRQKRTGEKDKVISARELREEQKRRDKLAASYSPYFDDHNSLAAHCYRSKMNKERELATRPYSPGISGNKSNSHSNVPIPNNIVSSKKNNGYAPSTREPLEVYGVARTEELIGTEDFIKAKESGFSYVFKVEGKLVSSEFSKEDHLKYGQTLSYNELRDLWTGDPYTNEHILEGVKAGRFIDQRDPEDMSDNLLESPFEKKRIKAKELLEKADSVSKSNRKEELNQLVAEFETFLESFNDKAIFPDMNQVLEDIYESEFPDELIDFYEYETDPAIIHTIVSSILSKLDFRLLLSQNNKQLNKGG